MSVEEEEGAEMGGGGGKGEARKHVPYIYYRDPLCRTFIFNEPY